MIVNGINLTNINVYDASIITQNLAIYIDANNASSYPGTGITITDLSGNGRTQNLASSSQYTILSGVKCFNCNTDYITASTASPLLPTTGFTYICWARMMSSTSGWRTLLRCYSDDHPILIQINTNNLGMFDNPTASFYSSGYSVAGLADIWVQWAVTGDSSGQTFYINGVQVGSTTQTAAGNNHWNTGGYFNQPFGYVANMLLYTSKLTNLQILQNYYYFRGRFGV